ncbi:L-serine ammonia-lyase, iron-sulfur-dependent subunit beta [Sporolactobacillus laevolacticus]|jgi:L-serine dehydratase|uniref:L-serine ammonia-lyase, iron-sulfur-dependent subunit beta n=1 Tax=Sporolactobacillus laevolacticus TaxID=33018 RepID=UPI0025B36BBD|nr:L-serine ammonia-lyase, iron-sulfur-dependent subunit beta [Sporolactobacillus laevolacticus]MDF2909163.1 sdaAB [Sporolactobacillus laevolacticus]MDN3954034.1 L-serine ammonia-lyase, iron-sulfur-dependent subunit beta [Sporolactobacillus laevolacticus]
MKYRSVFDIIGPVMVGPSSSHTAGAAKIGRMARKLLGEIPEHATVTFYGSFAETYKGHGTDVAIVAGLLDFDESNTQLPQSLEIAEKKGMDVSFIVDKETQVESPNTARVHLSAGNTELELVGVSIGGGKIELTEVNGFSISLTGSNPALLVLHYDKYGAVAEVAGLIAKYELNISYMEVSRQEKGRLALMVIQTDEEINEGLAAEIAGLPNILNVAVLS